MFQPATIVQLHMQHYRTARAQATLDVFRRASPADGTRGRTVAQAISILAGRNISLASISSKVSDDSLSRLVARVGCRVSPHIHSTYGWPAGGAGAASRARHV